MNLIDVFIKKIELSENKIKIQYKLGDKKTCSYNLLNGGDGGNRTPVQNQLNQNFSECSLFLNLT